MIYLHPIGGLGNMFYQIASIWTLAKDNGDELCLTGIGTTIKHLTQIKNRKGALGYFYIFNRFLCTENASYKQINYNKYPYWVFPLEYKEGYQYIGYFQDESYFKHRRAEILELFRPTEEIQQRVLEYAPFFNEIGMHVRRGDFVDIGIAKPLSFYEEEIEKQPKDLKILVFSDDLEWCKENFIGERFVFVDEVDYVCMYIIGKMKYFINVDSTFSWWGKWMKNE